MAKAPKDGIRIGGVDYPSGATLPERYSRAQTVSTRQRDPAITTPDSPPNMGRMVLPQVITFSGLTTSLARAYRYSDAALRASVENAHMMLADPQIQGPLLARQSMVALLNWSVESENDEEPQLKEAAQRLTKILAKTPRFTEYRRALMEAIWYGRYAIQNAFCFHTDRTGKRSRIVKKWSPISGDKLMFRYDDGSGDFDPDQVGVRVTPALGRKDIIGGDRQLEATGEGMAYFLQPWERRHLCIHKHMIRDGEYEDPLSGGQIHGVGLRHFLYWVWYQKQETMAQIAEIVDRTGNGFTIYYYPEGNPAAKEEVQKVAREQAHTNVILMPTDPANPNAYEVQQIPPNTTGLQVLHDFVETFLGDMIIRFILGQTLSSKPDSTGMGSGIAELQKDTLFQIARYDAVNLEETITRELLLPLRDFNLSKYRNVDFFFKISTKVSAPEQELAAIQKAYDMGAEIKTSDIFDKLDLSMPKPGDKTLFNPQIIGAIKQLNTPQPPPGAPPGPPGGPAGPEAGGPDQGGPPPDEGGGAPPVDQGPDAGTPEQLDKVPQDDEKQRLFGPILYSRKQEYRDRLRAAVDATDANPSEQQKLAGNYRKGKFWWHSIEIAIENPKGTKRRKEWPAIAAHYGYMRRTLASDGDALDAFIGPELESELVIIIAQMNQTGRFDEFKVVIGFSDTEKAIQCYCDSYSFRPEFWYASITTDQFTQAILNDDGNSTTVASRRILDLEGHASTVSERKILALPLVWWKGNSRLREVGQLCDILERHGASPDTTTHNRAGKFQRRLLSGELPLGDENGAKSQHYSKSKVSGEDDLAVVRGNWNPSKDNHNAAESGLELEGGCNNSAKDASQGLPTVDAQWNQQATVPLGERGKYGSGNSAIQNPVGMDDGRGSLNSSGKASALQSLTSPIFDGDRIKPEIGERLRQIARDFIRGTAIPRDAIQDVVLTGSLASGGWTGQSDLDLHITVDSEAIPGDPDMVRDYLYEVGANWNARHGITILGHEVEIFVEPVHVFPEQYAKRKYAKQLSLFDEDEHPRASESVSLGGKDYKPGEWIPKDKAEDATKSQQEKIEVVDNDTGSVESLEQKSEKKESDPSLNIPDDFESFKKAYQDAFKQMMKYDPDKSVGAGIWAERMSAMSEAHPDWAEQIENSVESQKQNAVESKHEQAQTAADSGGRDLRRQPDEREPSGTRDLGANRVKPPEERIVTARKQHTAPGDRSLVPEKLRQHLDDHQQEGVAKAIASLNDNGGVLVADGTGVGKTRQLLAVGQHYLDQGKKVLVVAPKGVTKADWAKKTVTGSWQNDSQAMGVSLNVTRDEIAPSVVNISSYDNLSKLKHLVDDNTVLLLDEAHSLKNRDSARSKHGTEMADKAHAVLFATATPVDKVEHLHYLDRAGVFGDQFYGRTYEQLGLHQVDQHIGGGQTVKKWQIRPGVKASEVMRRMSGLFDRLTADGKMIKREISMEGVPVSVERVQLPAEAHELMERIETELSGTSANEGLERARILMHQRRQQEPYKVPSAVKMAKEALDNGRQFVIFASRVNESTVGDDEDENAITSEGTMKLLREELERQGVAPGDIAEIHGGMKKNQIPKEMEKFQSGKAKVVIATVESGGTGINLDDTAGDRPRTLLMMTAPFSAVENVQAAGRVWRLKTKSVPEIKYLFADTEVDDWNAALISKKMQALGASVSGHVGALDVNKLDESTAIDYEPEEPFAWKYPGEGQPASATFSRLESGEWGLRIEGKVKPGDTVQVTTKDGRKSHKVIGKVVKKGKGITLATIGDQPASPPRIKPEDLPAPPPIDKASPVVSDEKKQAIHAGLRQLAAMDQDRAREINNMGFSKFDGEFGHQLAAQDELSDRQALAGEKLVNKYRRQLDTELVQSATKKEAQPEAVPTPTQQESTKKTSHPFMSLATWSSPKTVNTSQGTRVVRSAQPSEKFWSAWRKDKDSLKRQGISVSKYQGDWQVSWWMSPEEANKYRKLVRCKE